MLQVALPACLELYVLYLSPPRSLVRCRVEFINAADQLSRIRDVLVLTHPPRLPLPVPGFEAGPEEQKQHFLLRG